MTENDYIAEYVKEKRPELLNTVDFITWRFSRSIANMLNEVTRIVKDFCKTASEADIKKILEEDNDNEQN